MVREEGQKLEQTKSNLDENLTIGSPSPNNHVHQKSPKNSTVDQTGPTGFQNRSDLFSQADSGKTQPAEEHLQIHHRISQTTWSLETKLWGDDEHLKERLCPKNLGLKLPTTPGITDHVEQDLELEFIQNPSN